MLIRLFVRLMCIYFMWFYVMLIYFDIFCMCWYSECQLPYLSSNFSDSKSCNAQTAPLEFKLKAMRWEAAEVVNSGEPQPCATISMTSH